MNTSMNAQRLVHYILSLNDFEIHLEPHKAYEHMGATLVDAILQAGLNYQTVVAPRVKRVIENYPEANTTSAFWGVIQRTGADSILNWRHPEKPRRLVAITIFLIQSSINTETELRDWFLHEQNGNLLLEIRGIGPKTVDYLKNLVNVPTVAVDRHIRNFVLSAGILYKEYDEFRMVVEDAAKLLNIPNSSLDHAIWLYMSNKNYK